MARASLLALVLPWLLAAVPLDPPPPVALTADEQGEIDAGNIVVRMDTSGDTGGAATGITDVAADVDQVWRAVLDLKARIGEVGGLKGVEYYLEQGDRLAARWQLKVLTVPVVFHVDYRLDRPNGWVRYALDTSRENDLVDVQGAYQMYPNDRGGTRLVFISETDSGRNIPTWIKRWLATDSLREQMGGIKARAEAAR